MTERRRVMGDVSIIVQQRANGESLLYPTNQNSQIHEYMYTHSGATHGVYNDTTYEV